MLRSSSSSGGDADGTSEAIIGFLRSEGAAGLTHARGRSLLEHLTGTHSIVRRWGQPAWLQHAALIHSAYGTEAYGQGLLPLSRRNDLASVAGDRAERAAYLFCVTPRGPLLAGTHLWARDLPSRSTGTAPPTDGHAPTRDELDALVLLHMANVAEQAQAADGSPGRWLAKVGELSHLLVDSESVKPPTFVAHLAAFSAADESLVRGTYRDAVGRGDDPEGRASRFALTAAVCPVLPEPCVWLAALSRWRRDAALAKSWAVQARNRILELGTPWDKRLTLDEWLAIIAAVEYSPSGGPQHQPESTVHPRALFEAVVQDTGRARASRNASAPPERAIKAPDAAAGRRRFQTYVEGLASADGSADLYPDLPSQPWHNPQDFPLVGYLEANYPAIRDEILALDGARFHRESERIRRTGDWDVAFLYERGRRDDEVCASCPVTTRGVETYPTMRSATGLIYVSRMRGSTHIEAHRGPTNLRVRCHLALKIPEGDCAIRVGEQTRKWQEGRSLVFDDHFDHEAWNHTDEDRIVLIVDMWHPGLSPTEVTLLEALNNHTHTHAQKLTRYWSANATAARRGSTVT